MNIIFWGTNSFFFEKISKFHVFTVEIIVFVLVFWYFLFFPYIYIYIYLFKARFSQKCFKSQKFIFSSVSYIYIYIFIYFSF